MNKNQLTNAPNSDPGTDPETDQSAANAKQNERWDELFETIAALAHRRSKSLLAHHDEDDDAFDRGARALRTLMSAAEVAQRMKQFQAKESQADDQGAEGSLITEAAIDAAYRKVSDRIDRLERGESEPKTSGERGEDASDQDGSPARGCERTGGASLGGECA